MSLLERSAQRARGLLLWWILCTQAGCGIEELEDTRGTPLFVERFGDEDDQEGLDLVVGGDVVALLGHRFGAGDVDFGCTSATQGAGEDFVVQFDSGSRTGLRCRATTMYSGGNDVDPGYLAVNAKGDIATIGTATDAEMVDEDIFVARIDPLGTVVSQSRIGNLENSQWHTALALSPAGDVWIGGSFYGSIDFGEGTSLGTLEESGDAFVAALRGEDLTPLRVIDLQGGEDWDRSVDAMATGPDGSLVFAGTFVDLIDFTDSCGPIASWNDGMDESHYIVKLDPAGSCAWSGVLGNDAGLGDGSWLSTSIAIDPTGDIVLAGSMGDVSLFSDQPDCALDYGDGNEMFVAKLSGATGACVWSKKLDCTNESEVWGVLVAVNQSGEIFLSSSVLGRVAFDAAHVLDSKGADNVFIAKLDRDGNHVWSRQFGGSDTRYPAAIAIDADENVLVAGSFSGVMDFGPPVGTIRSAGGLDVFVAKFAP
jgi:hypothetical protein